jgi:hypothetical protein
VASSVNANSPAVVGAPKISPICAFNCNPGGSLPLLSRHDRGGCPPTASKWIRYLWPTAIFGGNCVRTRNAGGAAWANAPQTERRKMPHPSSEMRHRLNLWIVMVGSLDLADYIDPSEIDEVSFAAGVDCIPWLHQSCIRRFGV